MRRSSAMCRRSLNDDRKRWPDRAGALDANDTESRGEDDAMSSLRRTAGARTPSAPDTQKLLEQYGCGPIQFTGTADALYERHLLFDNVIDPAAVGARERYEAVARSVRDVLSQRWVRTEKRYDRQNPKRV